MSQITNNPSAICFNLDCPQPQNDITARFCAGCQASLHLQERYAALKVLGQGRADRFLLALDTGQSPGMLYVFQQSRLWDRNLSFSEPEASSGSETIRLPWQLSLECLIQLSSHPQIPTVFQGFEQDGCLFQIQEYIPGPNLATNCNRALPIATPAPGNWNPSEIWTILQGVLPILEYLQTQSVIHGDIKPENIRMRGDDLQATALVLVDFRTAHRIISKASLLPSPVVGSAEYAAPEQLAGAAGFASDLYSLGVTCIQLLTGMSPLSLLARGSQAWVWRDYWLPDLDPEHLELANFLDRLISPDLSQRFASASVAIAALPRRWHPRSNLTAKASTLPWRCFATLQGHQGLFASVNAVAISPQGDATGKARSQTIASASDDQTVRIWDGETGKQLQVLWGHAAPVKTVMFHPFLENVLISAGCDRKIRIWDLATGQLGGVLEGHQQQINTLAWSPDGSKIASGSADKTIKLWEFSTGECLATVFAHRLAVNALAFSPQNPVLASVGMDARVQVWNSLDLNPIQTLKQHLSSVRAIAFSPDGDICATAGQDCQILLWDAKTWQRRQTFSGHSWLITGLTFSPDGNYLFSSSWDNTLKCWDLATGQVTAVLVGHRDCVTGVAISNLGNILASGSRDLTIRLWSRDPAKQGHNFGD